MDEDEAERLLREVEDLESLDRDEDILPDSGEDEE
jgi:hypothetical protein